MASSSHDTASGGTPRLDRHSLYATYGAGLLSMGQSELLGLVIPLWAIFQGASPTEIGILVGARSMLTFFLAIHGGALMDRLGTRQVMMFFAVATGGLAAVYPLLPWFPVMVAMQTIIGFAGNMAWIGAQTLVAQVTGGDPGLIGRFSFFARLGNVIAPLLMGLLWDLTGPQISFLGITLWCCFLFMAVSRVRITRRDPEKDAPFRWRDILPRLSDYTGSIGLIVLPAVILTLAISFIRHATNGVEQSFFIVYLRDVGFAGTMIGIMFSIAELANGASSLAAGRIAKWMPIPWAMVGFTALAIVFIGITPLLGGSFLFLAAAHTVRRCSEGLVQPLVFSLQSRAVAPDLQGSVVGLRVTNNRLSSILTPIIMGVIVEHFGIHDGFIIMSLLLLTVCGALALAIAFVPALRALTKRG